jgi:hypothetical protein
MIFSRYTALLSFNFYTLLTGKDTLKQNTVHLSVACHVHVLCKRQRSRFPRVNGSQLS